MPIEDGKVVRFRYTLKNADGQVLDASGDEPFAYLHGAGNIVTGLEQRLEGREAGESLSVTVPPEEAYGTKQGPGPQSIPRTSFPRGMELEPGMPFVAENPEGESIQLWVVALSQDTVVVDINHPLAGQTLHFDVDLVDLRDATEAERAQGHPEGMQLPGAEPDTTG